MILKVFNKLPKEYWFNDNFWQNIFKRDIYRERMCRLKIVLSLLFSQNLSIKSVGFFRIDVLR